MAPPTNSKHSAIRWLERLGPLLALVVLVAVGTVWSDTFRKPENFIENILWAVAPVGIVAVGMTFVITLGGIDLSVGSAAALLGVLLIKALNGLAGDAGPTWGQVALVGLGFCAAGLALGAFNGALIAYGRIAPFIVTLGTMAAYKSLAQFASGDGVVMAAGERFGRIGQGGIPLATDPENPSRVTLMLPWPVIAFAAVAVAGHLVLTRTTYGARVRAIGDNETAARYAGVPVRAVRFATYALAGLTAGLGSLMSSSYLNSASHSQTGVMWELDAIAAVVIGGTRMSGGWGTVIGTVIGAIMLGVINNLLVMFDVNPSLQGVFKGSIIVAAVLVQRGRKS